jgi:GntR family transcriptional regulator
MDDAGRHHYEASRRLGNSLHRQIFLVLRDRILSRQYAIGEMLPSEEEFVRLFGVSRSTLRQALGELERAGLIERRHGVGTFVLDQGSAERLHASMADLVIRTEEIGRSTQIKVLDFDYVPAPPDIQAILGLDGGMRVQRAVRLRLSGAGKPIMYITSYIPEDRGPLFDAAAMTKRSLYDNLLASGCRLVSASQNSTAILCEPVAATHLEIEVGSPLLRFDRTSFADGKQPISHIEVLANPMYFQFHMELDPASS